MNRLIGLLILFFTCCRIQAQHTDIEWLRNINLHRNTSLDPLMKGVSNTEAWVGVGLPLGVVTYGLLAKKPKDIEHGFNMTLSLALVSVQTFVLKRAINRPRPAADYPDIQAVETERNYSFPSGHTSNAFCTATSLSLNYRKWYIACPAYLWACSVGYSRMHLGMHYPSDVLAGALLGMGSAWFSYQAQQYIRQKFEKRYQHTLP